MISLRNLVSYSSQLSMGMKSGIPIRSVFRTLEKAAPTRKLGRISRGIREEIDEGGSLTSGFAKYKRHFPGMFISFINVGEKTGHLEDVTAELADFYQNRYRIMTTMKGSLLTTAFYFSICLALIIFIEYVFADWDIAVVHRYLLYTGVCVILFLLIPWAFYKHVREFRLLIQPLIHSLPFLGSTLKKFALSNFASGMALGLRCGMEIRETIRFSAEAMDSPMMERKALRAIDYINEGNTIAESLQKTKVFPTLMNQMYATGEETGELSEMMRRVALITREQAENALKTITTVFAITLYLSALLYIAIKIILFWQELVPQIIPEF